jgi:hypothetical protein
VLSGRVLPYWPDSRYLELAPNNRARTRAKLLPAEIEAPFGSFTVPVALSASACVALERHRSRVGAEYNSEMIPRDHIEDSLRRTPNCRPSQRRVQFGFIAIVRRPGSSRSFRP